MAKKDKRLWIDMCAGSELKDTQGETLSVDGADINDLELGKGRFNDNHGKGFFNSLGRVTEAKKIFKAEDCDNARQEYYWDKIKAPFVYCKGYLYNDEDHPNARAAAAILRNIHREDAPLSMKASVEGGVVSRGISDPTRLTHTKIHSIALTFTPANNATLVEPLNIDKSSTDWEADKRLIKSVMHLAETNVPSFRHIERHASANTIHDNILKIQELAKSLGIEIDIKDSDPDTIMQKAILHKVYNNVNKINELVKAAKDLSGIQTVTSPGKVKMVSEAQQAKKLEARDRYQQAVTKLKSDPTTPKAPIDTDVQQKDISRVKSASQVKSQNVMKLHAGKAMRDPEHLGTVHKELTDRGIHPEKVQAIIDKVKSHMTKGDNEEVEKGDISRAGKNLLLAGAMGLAVHHMGPNKDVKVKPDQAQTREAKMAEHNKKVKDPDRIIGAKKLGYDERQPDAKAKFREARRKKLKKGLKKALTAGYGGGGAPTGLTGGGVFQEESLEDGRKSEDTMTYITCNDCGHEQVYMGHQVKCRGCNSNFSLDKLKNHI